MSYTLITGPASEPVTEQMLRDHATLDDAVPSSLLTVYLAASRATAEFLTGRALLPQTWEAYFDDFDSKLGLTPATVASVTSVKYYDAAGLLQTISSSNYVLDSASSPNRVLAIPGYEWPTTQERANAVVIRYISGWASASAVPADLKNWILIRAATAVDNRESVDRSGRLAELRFVDTLLAPWVTERGAMWGV